MLLVVTGLMIKGEFKATIELVVAETIELVTEFVIFVAANVEKVNSLTADGGTMAFDVEIKVTFGLLIRGNVRTIKLFAGICCSCVIDENVFKGGTAFG